MYEGSSVHKMDQQWVSIGMLGINVCGILCWDIIAYSLRANGQQTCNIISNPFFPLLPVWTRRKVHIEHKSTDERESHPTLDKRRRRLHLLWNLLHSLSISFTSREALG